LCVRRWRRGIPRGSRSCRCSSPSRAAPRCCGCSSLAGRSRVADNLVWDLDWRVAGGADDLRVGDGGGLAGVIALVGETAGDVAEEVFVAADAVRVELVATGDSVTGCELLDARFLYDSLC
jgi:hypothetical protein